jgi:hypothetical protein
LLAILRTVLVNTVLFNPVELPAQVRRLSRWIQMATLVQAFVLLGMAEEVWKASIGFSAVLLALGGGALVVGAFYERMVDRSAFPQAFARHTSSEEEALGRRGPKQRLGRIMASIQFGFAALFAVAVFSMSRDASKILPALATHSEQPPGVPSWLAPVAWAGLVFFVALTFMWTVTAAEMWRKPVPMARAFRRWFLYFLVPDTMVAFGGLRRNQFPDRRKAAGQHCLRVLRLPGPARHPHGSIADCGQPGSGRVPLAPAKLNALAAAEGVCAER